MAHGQRTRGLPVHAALAEDRRRDRRGQHVPALRHPGLLRTAVIREVVVALLETTQRVLGVVEAAATRAANAVLVELAALGARADVSVGRVRQASVCELAAALDRAVDEEHEDEDGDGAERADDTDDGVLPRLAAVARGTAGVAAARTVGAGDEVRVCDGLETEARVDVRCEGLRDVVRDTGVECGLLGLDLRGEVVYLV